MESSLEYLQRLADTGLLDESVMTELNADATLTRLSPKRLAEELTRRQLISKYQSRALLRSDPTTFDIGDYRVIGRYTEGFRSGMFQAIHRQNGQRVELDRLAAAVTLSENEWAAIEHPNLISCRDLFTDRSRTFVVHDRASGRPLDESTPNDACEIVRQIASATWALHSHGLVHGKICPAAVLIDDGIVRLSWRPGWSVCGNDKISVRMRSLLDAWYAAALESPTAQTSDATQSMKSDVKALGLLLDQLLDDAAARTPFLDQLIASLIGDTDRRFEHAGPVEALLRNSNAPSLQITTEGMASASPSIDRRSGRNRTPDRIRVAAIAATSVLAIVTAWWVWQRLSENPRDANVPEMAGAEMAVPVVTEPVEIHGAVETDPMKTGVATASKDTESSNGNDATHDERSVDELSKAQKVIPVLAKSGDPTEGGASLWSSPTSGGPIELRHLPNDAQLFLHLRPAEMLADVQSRLALEALGPDFQTLRTRWESDFGMDWSEIGELTVAISPRDASLPDVCFIVRSRNGRGLPSRWRGAPAMENANRAVGGPTIRVLDEHAVWDSGDGILFGNASTVREVAFEREQPMVLPRELGQLRQATDNDQLFSALLSPRFLSNQKDRLVSPQLASVRDGILEALGDQTRGCSLGLHIRGEAFYGEFRFASDDINGALAHGRRFRSFLQTLPQQMETALAELPSLDGYWRRLALRSVRMVDCFEANLRWQAKGRVAFFNVNLPARAAHNLALVTELVTASLGKERPMASRQRVPRRSLNDVLRMPIRVEIPQLAIEMALHHVRDQVNQRLAPADSIEIVLDGPALQSEGITRNQQVRHFRRDNVSLSDVLTGLVMTANPTPGAAASDSAQELVWIASSEPDRIGKRIILITTRTEAEKKGHSLPSIFQSN